MKNFGRYILFLLIAAFVGACGSDNNANQAPPPVAPQPAPGYGNGNCYGNGYGYGNYYGGSTQWGGPNYGGNANWGCAGGSVQWNGPRGGGGSVQWNN